MKKKHKKRLLIVLPFVVGLTFIIIAVLFFLNQKKRFIGKVIQQNNASFQVSGEQQVVRRVKIEKIEQKPAYRQLADFKNQLPAEKVELISPEFLKINLPDITRNIKINLNINWGDIPDYILKYNEKYHHFELFPFYKDQNENKTFFSIKQNFIFIALKEKKDWPRKDNLFEIWNNNEGALEIKLDPSILPYFLNDKEEQLYFKLEKNKTDHYPFDQSHQIKNWQIKINHLKSGVFTLVIYTRQKIPIVIWEQDIFVQEKFETGQAAIAQAVQKFAPILLYAKHEKYQPISLNDLFSYPSQAFKMKTLDGGIDVRFDQLGRYLTLNGHKNYLIDMTLFNTSLNQIDHLFSLKNQTGVDKERTVYYSYFEDDTYSYINYHFIYTYDPKGAFFARLFAQHNFDRESMGLVFKKGVFKQPLYLVVSGHLENQAISLLDTGTFFKKELQTWKQGRIKLNFNQVKRFLNHPIIAVAKGSHALYPVSGHYRVINPLGDEAAGIQEKLSFAQFDQLHEPGKSGSQILIPDNDSFHDAILKKYRIVHLELNQLTSRNQTSQFLCFSGDWVDVLGKTNAKFPPFTKNIRQIRRWSENGYAWDWQPGRIPEKSVINQERIKGYLGYHLIEKPVDFKVVQKSSRQIQLQWNEIDGINHYHLYRFHPETGQINLYPVAEPVYTDQEVIQGAEYRYWLYPIYQFKGHKDEKIVLAGQERNAVETRSKSEEIMVKAEEQNIKLSVSKLDFMSGENNKTFSITNPAAELYTGQLKLEEPWINYAIDQKQGPQFTLESQAEKRVTITVDWDQIAPGTIKKAMIDVINLKNQTRSSLQITARKPQLSINALPSIKIGTRQSISWSSQILDGSINLELFKNDQLVGKISSQTENNGLFDWLVKADVPLASSDQYQIKVSSALYPSISDFSPKFIIYRPYQFQPVLNDGSVKIEDYFIQSSPDLDQIGLKIRQKQEQPGRFIFEIANFFQENERFLPRKFSRVTFIALMTENNEILVQKTDPAINEEGKVVFEYDFIYYQDHDYRVRIQLVTEEKSYQSIAVEIKKD